MANIPQEKTTKKKSKKNTVEEPEPVVEQEPVAEQKPVIEPEVQTDKPKKKKSKSSENEFNPDDLQKYLTDGFDYAGAQAICKKCLKTSNSCQAKCEEKVTRIGPIHL